MSSIFFKKRKIGEGGEQLNVIWYPRWDSGREKEHYVKTKKIKLTINFG